MTFIIPNLKTDWKPIQFSHSTHVQEGLQRKEKEKPNMQNCVQSA